MLKQQFMANVGNRENSCYKLSFLKTFHMELTTKCKVTIILQKSRIHFVVSAHGKCCLSSSLSSPDINPRITDKRLGDEERRLLAAYLFGQPFFCFLFMSHEFQECDILFGEEFMAETEK